MRTLLDLMRVFVFVCAIAARLAFACDQLPAGQSLWIRLTAPVSTYTAKAGDPVHAVLTQDLVCENDVLLPMGTPIEGVVLSKRKVGWGIRHETAALELGFNRAIPIPGAAIELGARVEEVENAREPVRKGVIEGIRSSDTFQGSINSRLIHLPTWNPYSDPVLIAYKAVFPIFPEPEIYYPAGTDIRLRTTEEVSLLPMVAGARESFATAKTDSDPLGQFVEQLPWRVTTKKEADADLINIVFVGSEDAVKSAFREAGWENADSVSERTVMKNLYALLNKSSYARQPMMTFYLNGKPEDMNWQKGLNGYDRRDHLRIWQWTSTEGTVWVSSSTHDTGAMLSVKHRAFVHHIAPAIDDERSTIVRDLDFAGCVSSVRYVARPEMPMTTRNAVGDVMHTDGLVAVVALQHCKPVEPQPDAGNARFRPGNYAFRFVRRQILTFRNDIVRANIIYGAYDVGRMTFVALRHQSPK
ncbi:MAG TPA: LssY C-terminal domain-containing protein [Edaphobacter sp.]